MSSVVRWLIVGSAALFALGVWAMCVTGEEAWLRGASMLIAFTWISGLPFTSDEAGKFFNTPY